MIRLRLFSSTAPSKQLDQRMIGEDPITVGRDAAADWVIADPDRALSRRHCTVRAVGNKIGVRDTSANGTFVNDEPDRIEGSSETMVAPGGSIRIGTFTLSVEALADDAKPAKSAEGGLGISSFDPPTGLTPSKSSSRRAKPDPFASKLPADPLLADHRPTDRVTLGDGDAWDNRPAARAGDWELPRDRPDHENLIGTPREWVEPARTERDSGFGFDAPFDRPIVAPAATPGHVAIPADWAEPANAPAKKKGAAAKPAAPSAPTVESVVAEPVAPAEVDPPAPPPPPPPAPSPVVAEAPAPIPAKATRSSGAPAKAPRPAAPPPPPAPAPVLQQEVDQPASEGIPDDLFEAFCAGARLSPASFPEAERAAAMVRLGEVYRGMVLGLADLMGERTTLKSEYRMSRTMVRPEQNNPFKWVPPQRLAVEVLRGPDVGFAGGAEAVSESFRDIKTHIFCVLAGMRAAIRTTMTTLSPTAIEAGVEGRSFLIKAQRDLALWSNYVELFDRFKLDGEDADGAINRAFRIAYEKQLAELSAEATGYDGPPRGQR